MDRYYFLLEDFAVLQETINQLVQEIRDLGRRQGEAAGQSTENMGHDDACQEAINDERKLLATRINELRRTINGAVIIEPTDLLDSIRLGTTVELADGRVFRIGSYLVLAEYEVENISYNSPFAKAFIKKRVGDTVRFRNKELKVVAIRQNKILK